MERYLKKYVLEDLKDKMVFVGGARQVGKTTFAQGIAPKKCKYLNWDILKDRDFILKERVPLEKFVIFDEIHKFKNWRNYVKGIYDKYKRERKILITGSARLDYYRYSGDSLQGRYHYYRLHPLTVKELGIQKQKDFIDLLTLGGFPEVFLSSSHRKSLRWMREYKNRVIYEEIAELELSQSLSQMEALLLTLPELVGSPLSINSLRESMNLAHKTVAKWLDIFERMYLIFRISPFVIHPLRSIRKEKKHYHYNWAEVSDKSKRFENLIACHLLKWVHFQQDYYGENVDLCYYKDKDKKEVDFIITKNNRPQTAIECKLQSNKVSSHLKYFKKKFPKIECIQVLCETKDEFLSKEGIKICSWKQVLNKYL